MFVQFSAVVKFSRPLEHRYSHGNACPCFDEVKIILTQSCVYTTDLSLSLSLSRSLSVAQYSLVGAAEYGGHTTKNTDSAVTNGATVIVEVTGPGTAGGAETRGVAA